MTPILLKVCRAGSFHVDLPGSVISVPNDEAQRLIADNQAEQCGEPTPDDVPDPDLADNRESLDPEQDSNEDQDVNDSEPPVEKPEDRQTTTAPDAKPKTRKATGKGAAEKR